MSKYYWFVYAVASDTYYLGDVIDSRNGSFLWSFVWNSLKDDSRFGKLLPYFSDSVFPVYFSSVDAVWDSYDWCDCVPYCDTHCAVLSRSEGRASLGFFGLQSESYSSYQYKFRLTEGRSFRLCPTENGCAVNIYDNGVFKESVVFSGDPLHPDSLSELISETEYSVPSPVSFSRLDDGSVAAFSGSSYAIVFSPEEQTVDEYFYAFSPDGSKFAVICDKFFKVFSSDLREICSCTFYDIRRTSSISFCSDGILYIGFDNMFGYNEKAFFVRYSLIDPVNTEETVEIIAEEPVVSEEES